MINRTIRNAFALLSAEPAIGSLDCLRSIRPSQSTDAIDTSTDLCFAINDVGELS